MDDTKHKWTPEEDAYLAKHYRDRTHVDIGRHLGRSRGAVRNRAWRLGLQKKVYRHGQTVEDAVRSFYDSRQRKTLGLAEFCRERNLPEVTVCKIASRLGLTDARRPKPSNGEALEEWKRNNPHPRGMLGKMHSAQTRARIAETSKQRWAAMSKDEQSAQVLKGLRTRKANGTLINHRPYVSWKQGWYTVGGQRLYLRSSWEANYAHYLEWLRERGEIAEWAYEQDTFWFEAIRRGTRSYTPDFRVTENDGSVAYHEVKGWMDARSETKLRRMAKYHPGVKVLVVDAQAYRALNRKALGLVPGWV